MINITGICILEKERIRINREINLKQVISKKKEKEFIEEEEERNFIEKNKNVRN